MKRTTVIVKLPTVKRRAIELYHAHSPFRAKVVTSQKIYNRKRQKDLDKDHDS